MPICPVAEMLEATRQEKNALGAFNVGNMEMLLGVIKAAEETGKPAILQIAEKRLRHSPLALMGPMMVNAAKESKACLAIHLDHGETPDTLRQAMDCGFNSIMFDGSHLPLAENIRQTAVLAKEARARGVDLEAEIGVLGGNEGGGNMREVCTDPAEAATMGEKSGCVSLAVAIGNAHGHYAGKPKLNFQVLREISRRVHVPLVLHGGTGIPDEDFRKAISLGVCKINIATAIFDATVAGVAAALARGTATYFDLNEKVVEAVYAATRHHIEIFSNPVA